MRSICVLFVSCWNYSLSSLDHGLLHGDRSMHAMELVIKAYISVSQGAWPETRLVVRTTGITDGSAALVSAPQRRDRRTTVLAREDEASSVLIAVERVLGSQRSRAHIIRRCLRSITLLALVLLVAYHSRRCQHNGDLRCFRHSIIECWAAVAAIRTSSAIAMAPTRTGAGWYLARGYIGGLAMLG